MYHMGTYSGVHSYDKKPAPRLQSILQKVHRYVCEESRRSTVPAHS